MRNENFALRLENLVVRHGAGCGYCKEPESAAAYMEHNRCSRYGTIWAVRDISIQWVFFPARFHGR